MKKIILMATLLTLIITASAQNLQKTGKNYQPIGKPSGKFTTSSRPEYSVINEPTSIKSSFYDYFPGSYCSLPLRVLADGSCYTAYHATETSSSTRRVNLAHINANGLIDFDNYLSSNDLREGYAGISLDPDTQDPLVAWHVDLNEDTHYDNAFAFDQYHFISSPGILSTPFIVVDNYDLFQQGILEFADDEFIWPYVFTAKSPTYDTDGKRRVYILGSNFTSHDPDNSASENILLTWADYSTEDIESGTFEELDWHYEQIDDLNGYNQADPYWARFHCAMDVTDDGKVALIGFLTIDSEVDTDNLDELTIFYNENWGEGGWTKQNMPSGYVVDNPLTEQGEPWLSNENGEAAEVFFDTGSIGGHFNAHFDFYNRLHFVSTQLLHYEDQLGDGYILRFNNYVKSYIYDFNDHEFQINDLYPQSLNPNDQQPYLPWDVNEDGEVDEYDPDGNPILVDCWPIHWQEYDDAFYENNFKIVGNQDSSLMVAVWIDGLYHKYFNVGGDTDYEAWNEKTQIAIATSNDDGTTWSEPMYLNSKPDDANYVPELDDMIVSIVYPGDVIEDIGNDNYKLHLLIYDDSSFGSFNSPASAGQDIGGTLSYMSISINVPGVMPHSQSYENKTKKYSDLNLSTYPNPFNPIANIKFSTTEAGNINVNVYNVKGELVKTIVNNEFSLPQEHSLKWNGRDNKGSKVASGVYFFKVETPNGTDTKKALMLK